MFFHFFDIKIYEYYLQLRLLVINSDYNYYLLFIIIITFEYTRMQEKNTLCLSYV